MVPPFLIYFLDRLPYKGISPHPSEPRPRPRPHHRPCCPPGSPVALSELRALVSFPTGTDESHGAL